MSTNTHTLFFCLLLTLTSIEKTFEIKNCSAVFDKKNNVQWPTAVSDTYSRPLCVNKNRELVTRHCVEGSWYSEPHCFYLQPIHVSNCPDGYVEVDQFCYILSSKSKYPPKCPFSNVAPFESYKHIITQEMPPVWAPIKRDESNGLGFMQWIEASPLYRTNFENYTYLGDSEVHNCIVYRNGSYESSSCDQEHVAICAYNNDDLRSKLCGDSCVLSDFTTTSKCICSTNLQKEFASLAKFTKPFHNKAATLLTTETYCTFGLMKTSNGTYVWNNTMEEITYTYWSQDAVFNDDFRFGAYTKSGWILTKQQQSCVLYETTIENVEPSLQLSYSGNGTFILNVTNPDFLVPLNEDLPAYCFTDADQFRLVSDYFNLTKLQAGNDFVAFWFHNLSSDPGNYWCEAFKSNDSSLIKSEGILLQSEALFEFVAVFEIKKATMIGDPISRNLTDFLQLTLLKNLTDLETVDQKYVPRIMKLKYVDVAQEKINVTIHFTSKRGSRSELEEFQVLWKKLLTLRSIKDNVDVRLLTFSSASTCFEEDDEALHWPETVRGSYATSEEFCLRTEGTRVRRFCNGTFIDGATWSAYDLCTVFQQSSMSKYLVTILDQQVQNVTVALLVSQNYTELLPLDVYLFGQILKNCANDSTKYNVLNIRDIINNLLKVDKPILRESQLMSGATNTILQSLDKLLKSPYGNVISFGSNFAFWSTVIDVFVGIAVYEGANRFRRLNANTTLDTIDLEHLQGAIWLSPHMQSQISANDYVIFTVYFVDSFFQTNISDSQNATVIFGVYLPDYVQFRDASIMVLQRIEGQTRNVSCKFWDYSNQGRWVQGIKPELHEPFVLCEFYSAANFAVSCMSCNSSDEVTDELVDVLNSNSSSNEIIDKLSNITDNFNAFRSIDVKYTELILEKLVAKEKNSASATKGKELRLKSVAKVVSNLQEIERQVLIDSQRDDQTTDKILSVIDLIIEQGEYQDEVKIEADNFVVVVADLNRTDFTGVAILNEDDSFRTEILDNSLKIGDVIGMDGFDSAVVLSSKLKNQLITATRVIITVFIKDALFNQQTKIKNVSKIFGVILPETHQFHGPVSMFRKSQRTISDEKCVYWRYNQPEIASGSWVEDGSKTGQSDIVRCDYWHTTHFSVLLTEHEETPGMDLLDYITTINCIVSVLCLLCIFFTALLFQRWRDNTGNKILLNFVFISIVQITVFYLSGTVKRHVGNYISCTIIGAVLHYSILAEFSWMFIMAVLQFRRLVVVFTGPPNCVLIKACICGYLFPLVPVICVLSIDNYNYVGSKVELCYPSGFGLYLGVWLPISIILVINCIIFVSILYNVVYRKQECIDVGSNDYIYQWRLGIFLFFMFGLTWVFGLLSNLQAGTLFDYLFCITATLQGCILFLFFIICHVNTRRLYSQLFRQWFYKVKEITKT